MTNCVKSAYLFNVEMQSVFLVRAFWTSTVDIPYKFAKALTDIILKCPGPSGNGRGMYLTKKLCPIAQLWTSIG